MSNSVELSDVTFSRLQKLAIPLVDTLETVIVKLADYWDRGHSSGKMDSPGASTEEQPRDRNKLPQKAFRLPLLEAMYQLGGKTTSKQATELVGRKLESLLGPGDRQPRSDGKERWQNAVHWNRYALTREGLFRQDSGHDVWELSEEGMTAAANRLAGKKHDAQPIGDTSIRTFDARSAPSLRHTKLLSVRVAGAVLQLTWNGLLLHMIRRLSRKQLENPKETRRLIVTNFLIGKKEDEGYRFLPDLGISVQGQDADYCWKGASHIARSLGLTLEVEFLWRMKEGAAFPGSTGKLSVP